ncbi:MAG: hypothetical protein AB8B89_09230 [Gammaproteobacteria bacterium]
MKQERFFENFMLGVTEAEIAVEDRELNIAAVHKLVSSSIHEINIISRNLNHQIFDRSDIVEAFSKFIRKNRNTSVRIILFDNTNVIKDGHRLINLADRVPSKISIKKLPKEYAYYNESLITADGKGFLHNPQSDRYEGSVSFNDHIRCAELDKTFTDHWHQSEVSADLRRVSI